MHDLTEALSRLCLVVIAGCIVWAARDIAVLYCNWRQSVDATNETEPDLETIDERI